MMCWYILSLVRNMCNTYFFTQKTNLFRGSDQTVKIWDMAAKECVHTFDSAHNNQVGACFRHFCVLFA